MQRTKSWSRPDTGLAGAAACLAITRICAIQKTVAATATKNTTNNRQNPVSLAEKVAALPGGDWSVRAEVCATQLAVAVVRGRMSKSLRNLGLHHSIH